MVCGTPVIGTNVGGIKFTVRDGETGYLVAPKDPVAIAERIAHLYQHPKLMALLSGQAVRRVNDLFTWKRVAKGMMDVYEEVLASGDPEQRDEGEDLYAIDQAFQCAVDTMQEAQRQVRISIMRAAKMITSCFAHGGQDPDLRQRRQRRRRAALRHGASRTLQVRRPASPARPCTDLGRDLPDSLVQRLRLRGILRSPDRSLLSAR
jgi:hypothetical protein